MSKVFEKKSQFWGILASVLLVGTLGAADYLTANELSFYLFYLLPVCLTTWYVNFSTGIFFAILSTGAWLAADLYSGDEYSNAIVLFSNTVIRFGFFIIAAYFVWRLRKSQETVQALARLDYVTEVFNSRYFHELLGIELSRSLRYGLSFTLVYLDLDNFKLINDRFGHDVGDSLIKFIAEGLKSQLRNSDVLGRLGGDEFAILFPETGQQEAEAVMSKVSNYIKERLNEKYSFITFSAGAVTFMSTPNSTEETIKIADQLMYSVKNSTKNGIRYSLYEG
jgi:diguanylate cyclase (GGDEF)-like protein